MAPRVLIVDDEQTLRVNLSAYLEDEGMCVTGVSSGEDAVAQLHSGAVFDVCVMDMRLPGMDGQETILALHAIDPDLLFIVHTGTAGYSIPAPIRQLGITEHEIFPKPMPDSGALAQTILRLARTRKYADD